MKPLPRAMHELFDPLPRRPLRPVASRAERNPARTAEPVLTLEEAERLIRRFEGRPPAIMNPFASFPNRSYWLQRWITASRTKVHG